MIVGGFFYHMEEKVSGFICVSQYGSRNKSCFSSYISILHTVLSINFKNMKINFDAFKHIKPVIN